MHDARHAITRRKAKNEEKNEHFVNSVIHACEESNRRHSYIKGKRIKKEGISLTEISIEKMISKSLLLEPVGTAGIGENAHRVALMLLYVEKQM